MGVFRFKRFEVKNELSAMKVNTDGVLLGAAATICEGDARVLDIGTGTGTIALMIAQRLSDFSGEFHIKGIDIDAPSAFEASENFEVSPWHKSLSAIHCSLQDYEPQETFDLIISNPPYFTGDLKAPEERRNTARHSDASLPLAKLFSFSASNLSERGRLSIILPFSCERLALREAASFNLRPFRILRIKTTESKSLTRSIIEFSRNSLDISEETLIIKEQGCYTSQYNSLVSNFYIFTN